MAPDNTFGESNEETFLQCDEHVRDLCLSSIAQLKMLDAPPPSLSSVNSDVGTDICDIIDGGSKEAEIYYISDLHLDYKIKEKYGDSVTPRDVLAYIDSVVQTMNVNSMHILLIAGDVSADIKLNELFFNRLHNIRSWLSVYYVLGNHELMGAGMIIPPGTDRCQFIIESYKEMVTKYGVTLLDNELCSFTRYNNPDVFTETDFLALSENEIMDIFSQSCFLLLGGTGYAGHNPKYNASFGLYGDTIVDLNNEKQKSAQFESFYDRLPQYSNYCSIIVLTHMPESDWCSKNPDYRLIHINGHTHCNQRIIRDDLISIRDNQIGYTGIVCPPKPLTFSFNPDIFRSYDDGIYEIPLDKYVQFYGNLGIFITRKKSVNITMLKNSGFYLFLHKSRSGLMLMDGGKNLRLSNNDISYYYRNMVQYALKMLHPYSKIREQLESISDFIHNIGGFGTIHGLIVDIDFRNHIYLNILDGSITPYYADDIIHKEVYENIQSLLMNTRPDLYERCLNYINEKSLPVVFNSNAPVSEGVVYEGTDIYTISRMVRKQQYIMENHVIRSWDDSIVVDETLLLAQPFPEIEMKSVDQDVLGQHLSGLMEPPIETIIQLLDDSREVLIDLELNKLISNKMYPSQYLSSINSLFRKLYDSPKYPMSSKDKHDVIKQLVELKSGRRRVF